MMKTMAAVMAMAAAALAPFGEAQGKQDGGKAEAVRKLDGMRVSVDFQDVKLDEALSYLREVTGLNLVLLPKAQEHAGDAPVRLKVKDLTVKSVLKLMLGSRNLAATWKDNAIVILPQADLQASVTLQMYDIRAQLMELKDFPGPQMELVSPNAMSPGMTGVTVTMIDDPKPPLIPEDVLVQLVKENTGGRSWESNDKAAISVANGMLVVSQSPSVHREIQKLLGLLGQYR